MFLFELVLVTQFIYIIRERENKTKSIGTIMQQYKKEKRK